MMIFLLLTLTPFSADKVEIVKEDKESIVYLFGNVVIEDENTKITCCEARLNETKNYVILIDDVEIIDKNGNIKSDFAIYYFKEKKGYLNGNVSLQTADEIITSDSLYYSGIEELVEVFNDVKIEDRKNNLIAYGNCGWYDLKEEHGYLASNPRLELLREDKEPVKINAREFQLNTGDNIFYGFDSVTAIIDSITVHCDTFSYNLKTEDGEMTMPVILEKNNELKGESGQFRMKNKEIESFNVQKGWSKYYTKEGSKNVVEGENINIIFQSGKATKIIVDGEPKGVLTLRKYKENAGD